MIISYPEALMIDPKRPYKESDRIINSIISNCLQDYAGFLRIMKAYKKKIRKCAFLGEEYTLTEEEQRTVSWLEGPTAIYNKYRTNFSKASMFRICVFTQTRATGLANKKMVDATVQEFLETVTVAREFKPDDDVVASIDWVLDGIVAGSMGGNPQFRISMSTSACTESSKKYEGKFGYLKRHPDRPSIPKFSPDNPGGQLGTWAFKEGMRRINESDPSVFKTNVAGIRENGKCRVVTSGSFYKDAFLQPFSHMTIQAIKNRRSLRDGLSAGRLGYKFIERVDHYDPIDGLVLFRKARRIMSVDWEKATDLPPFKSAHAITTALLKRMRLSDDIRKTIECIWPGSKDIYLNGKYVGMMSNGVPMGDPLTKTNLSLAHPICEAYAHKLVPNCDVVHAGNGDDTIIIVGADTNDQADTWLKAYNFCTEALGYRISQNDFFITSTWGTYCEEVFHIPVDRFNTVKTASKLKDNRLMPYLDHPKMRLVIDTVKDRRDYSSDISGKITLLGKDLEYAEAGHEAKLFDVASAMQDICLGVRYEQKPIYLPRQIYNVGKVPAFWKTESWANAIWSMPAKVVNISIRSMLEIMGELPQNLTKLRSVRSSERHFDGEAVSEVFTIPEDDPIKQLCIVRREDTHRIPPGVLERLTDSKHLCTSRDVEALYLFMKRLETLEQTLECDLFELLRTKVSPLHEYTKNDVIRVCGRFRKKFVNNKWTLKRPFDVDYYYTSHIDDLRKCDPRTVNVEFEYMQTRFTKRLPPDTPKRRAEEELFEWFNRCVDDLIAGNQTDLPPTQILEDDPYIIQRVDMLGYEVNIIVTNDRKLTRLIQNKFPQKLIMRISIENWVQADADESSFINAINEDLKVKPVILVDEGSLDTFLLKTDIVPTNYANWSDTVSVKESRTQQDVYDTYLPPRPINSVNVYDFIEIVDSRKAPRIFGRRLRA